MFPIYTSKYLNSEHTYLLAAPNLRVSLGFSVPPPRGFQRLLVTARDDGFRDDDTNREHHDAYIMTP